MLGYARIQPLLKETGPRAATAGRNQPWVRELSALDIRDFGALRRGRSGPLIDETLYGTAPGAQLHQRRGGCRVPRQAPEGGLFNDCTREAARLSLGRQATRSGTGLCWPIHTFPGPHVRLSDEMTIHATGRDGRITQRFPAATSANQHVAESTSTPPLTSRSRSSRWTPAIPRASSGRCERSRPARAER